MTKFLKGNTSGTIDPKLATNPAITGAAERIYDLAYRCLNSDRRRRPSMDECGRVLWNIRKAYTDLVRNAIWLRKQVQLHLDLGKILVLFKVMP